jgi:hypothetical protein
VRDTMGLLINILRENRELSELGISPDQLERMRRKYYDRDEDGNFPVTGGTMDMTPTDRTPGTGAPAPSAAAPGTTSGTPAPGQRGPAPGQAHPPDAATAPMISPQAVRSGAPPDDPHVTNGIAGNYAGFVTDPHGYLSGQNKPINANVIRWLNKAGETMPGYHAEIAVGPSQHTPGTYTTGSPSQVPRGMAADIWLVDPKGNRIPHPPAHNSGENVPTNDPDFALYKQLGDGYITASGGQGRWGGYYGLQDRMQFGTVTPEYPRGSTAPADLYTNAQKQGDLTIAQNTPPPNQVASTDKNFVPGSAAPGSAQWTPGDYTNAPVESGQPISHPERNNPGNLRVGANPWQGKITPNGEAFEHFDTMANGIRARAITYGSYLNRGINTVNQISNTSGPANDGNNIESQNQAYRYALGGKYTQPGGENLPIDYTPENIRRLTAAGISIEAGGSGKWLPKGVNMPLIDQTIQGLHQEGRFGTPPSAAPLQTAQNAPPPASNQPPPTSTSASGAPPPPGTNSGTPTQPPQTASVAPTLSGTSGLATGIPPITTASLDTPKPQVESYRRPAIHLLRPF